MDQNTPFVKDAAIALAEYAADISLEQLPGEVVPVLKRIALDSIGNALAASTLAAECRAFVNMARDTGGTAESTVVGLGMKVPATVAALANGALFHALNYDDCHPGAGHLGAVTLPAALAMTEREHGSGKEFLAALAAGAEVMARIGLAVRIPGLDTAAMKPQPTQLLGFFGAAAGAGRALRLRPKEMLSAFGLALMQASGNRQIFLEARPAKLVYVAFPNYGGVLGALLSHYGLEADCSVLEGDAGLFKSHFGGKYDRPVLIDGLGEKFHTLSVEFKPWPITRYAHAFIEAALQLRTAHNFDVSSIDEIHIKGGPSIRQFCEPFSLRGNPQTAVEAGDSILFGVAKALANRNVTLEDFRPDGLAQLEVGLLMKRIRYSIDPSLGRSAGILELVTVSGERYARKVDAPLGDPSNPLSDEQIIDKFLSSARHATVGLSRDTLDQVVEFVYRLDTLADIEELTALIRAPRKSN